MTIVRQGPLVTVIASARGPRGRTGTAGIDAASYTHTQAVAAQTWVINHNLGYRPVVGVFSVGGIEVSAQVLHASVNQTQVVFTNPYAGFARLV